MYVGAATNLPDGDPWQTFTVLTYDMARLRGGVTRLMSRHAYPEFPYSPTPRLIKNVRITGEENDTIFAAASFIVYRIRRGEVVNYIGRYEYTLKEIDGSFRIQYRKAILDLETLRSQGTASIII